MANAAEKKAATARQEARNFYYPFLCIVNGIFLLLRILCWSSDNHESASGRRLMRLLPQGWPELLTWLFLIGHQYFCYAGILDLAATHNKNSGALVGGMYLDMLATTLIIQYIGGLLWTPMYWFCFACPLGHLYSLYTTMYQPKSNSSSSKTGPSLLASKSSSASSAQTWRRDNTTTAKQAEQHNNKEHPDESSPRGLFKSTPGLKAKLAERRHQRKKEKRLKSSDF